MDISEVEEFCEEYMTHLTPAMRGSNHDIKTLLKLMESGYERHYLKIVAFHNDVKKAHGLACVNVDQTFAGGHRAFIRHVSTIRPEMISQAVGLVQDFVWKRIYCDHIRIEQLHMREDPETEKITANAQFKKALTTNKFRWKSLINADGGKRYAISEIKRPAAGPDFENPRGFQQIGQEPVTFKMGVVMQLTDK